MYTAENVPTWVPRTKATQWAAVWNNVYDSALADEDKSRDEAEARAFRSANAILSRRSLSFKVDDFVGWKNENGIQQRGKVLCYVDGEPPADGEELPEIDANDPTPQLEVEQWKPVRDGWEATGKTVTINLADASKIDDLAAPTRAGRKETEHIRSATEEFVENVENYVKSVAAPGHQIKRLGQNTFGGHAITWGDEDQRDIEGDYFTKGTDLWLDVYQNQPAMFDHASGVRIPDDPALDEEGQEMPRRYKLGHIVKAVKDDLGLWVEGVVEAHNEWVEGVWHLIDKGALYFSSGSVPHLIKRTSGGEIKSWPVIEISMTPTPAEPRGTRIRAMRSADSTDALGDGQRAHSDDAVERSDGPEPEVPTSEINRRKPVKLTQSQIKRLSAFLDAFWDTALEDAASSVKSAKAAIGKKDASSEEVAQAADEVKEAGSQLDQLISPITDQAKSALGLEPDDVKAALFKMALGRSGGGAPAKQIPYDDAEDATMDGEFPEEDATMDGEFPEDEFATMDGEFPEDEFATMDGEFPEDEEAYASARSARPTARRSGGQVRSRRNADIHRAVEDVMNEFTDSRGGQMVRRGPGLLGRAKAPGLAGFLKATKDRDTHTLSRMAAKTNAHYKALGINPDTAGGYLVPPEHSDQIIELLRANSIFIGEDGSPNNLVNVLPMNRDTLTIPRQTGASTANWIGENATITASQETLGQIQLIARKLAVLVKVSNELLADGSPDVDAFIREDIAKTVRLKVDRAVLYGSGTAGEPRGVYNADPTYKVALNAVPTYDLLNTLVSQLEEANVDVGDGSTAWILHPRDKNAFRSLQDGNGAYIFASGALVAGETPVPKQLLDYPWFTTTQVTKTGSPEETDVFFGHWKDVIVAMRKTIEVVASDVAGTSFETDQTWIRCIMRLDVALRHPESVAIYTDVRKVVST